jgi:hypothetical protein
MGFINIAALINVLGFSTGAALYAMLLAMVLRHPAAASFKRSGSTRRFSSIFATNGLLLTAAGLGLVWNAGALAVYGSRELGLGDLPPFLLAAAYTALGFLPAVMVHAALRGSSGPIGRLPRILIGAAYLLSATAGAMHFRTLAGPAGPPSHTGLRVATFGYLVLLVVAFVTSRRQPGWRRAAWVSGLAFFAVSALHLSQHPDTGAGTWWVELLGHQASLPLALAILYQDYRFAFADLFLKRTLALFLLVGLASSLYVLLAAPLLARRIADGETDPRAIGVLLALWVATALLYPTLLRGVTWFVDAVLLRRTDYGVLRAAIAGTLAQHEHSGEALDAVCAQLAHAFTVHRVDWRRVRNADPPGDTDVVITDPTAGQSAQIIIPTAEAPYYLLSLGQLAGGRRLLSDDLALLEAVALLTARRFDAIRVSHERYEQGLREQEMGKLAIEAQLRALRSQVNPHFLFNALTTIGYLIKAAPDRALDTLLRLTELLRGVLREGGELVTLGDELDLIASYLEIERARFEERLEVEVQVPAELRSIRLPSFLVQPLVENAIKHGIARRRAGGRVNISAREERAGERRLLYITVSDTGAGATEIEVARGRQQGVGLNNVEQRLCSYCGPEAAMHFEAVTGLGATVTLRLPLAPNGQVEIKAVADPARRRA